jgi:hypothetical protein
MTTIRDGDNGLGDQSNGAPLRFPHYLATADGLGWTSTFDPYSDHEHALETASIVAWGAYFAAMAGAEPEKTELLACGDELYTTFSHLVTFWTRPNSTHDDYRVNPNRKYNWWFKNSSGFSWAMAAARADGEPVPPPPAENQPPSVTLTNPPAGKIFRPGSSVNLLASATDADGTVQRVEFYQGGTMLQVDASGPYRYVWRNAPAGTYSLWARATDDDGASTDSTAVTITVRPASTAQ